MLNDTPQWVAIYTNPRAEKKSSTRLQELGFETYLPLQRKLHRWSDRWKSVEVPLFPSYLFVKMRNKDVARIRNVEGVGYIVAWSNKPAIVPDSQVEAIRRLMEAEAAVNVVNDSRMKKGATVRIIGGQFEGMEGELISDCEEGNFGITITGLNVALVMEIEKDLLQVVEEKRVKRKRRGIWLND